ncbi:conserved protein of unknown function precursor containing a T9SS type B C-terminal secretion signal. Putative adhesin [Tenacibaculum sp. 190524A02b]|uniref:T9SS type B sorting domain-containing protein n=2 Tax=Tenacibaculum vairaonense TaxID=3137860 RepID=UPI0032B20EDE
MLSKKRIFFALTSMLCLAVNAQETQKAQVCLSPDKAYVRSLAFEKKTTNKNKANALPPTNTRAYTQSIHNAIARWDTGSYYRFSIGTAAGLNDISRGNLLRNSDKHTRGHSYEELRKTALAQGNTFSIGDTFYFSLYETSSDTTPSWVSPALKFEVETLGAATNNLTVNIETNYGVNGLGGFTTAQRDKMKAFYDLVNPIVKEVYGPPARNHEVQILNDGNAVGTNTFYNGPNQISTTYKLNRDGDLDQPRLMIHELVHAYRDNVVLSSNEEWHYLPVLSGFEEGMAEAVALIVMNLFIDRYPNFFSGDEFKVYWGHSRGMPFDWDYDFQNHEQLTTTDFFSSDIGTGAHWERYGTSQAAMQKMYIEDKEVFKKFNAEYYRRLTTSPNLIPNRDFIISIFKKILPEVERTPVEKWINEQRILDCKVTPGNKVHMLTFHSVSPPRMHALDNRLHVIQTQNLPWGNEWSWDEDDPTNPDNSKRWYIQTNNLDGNLSIYNYDNTINQSVAIKNDKRSRSKGVAPYLGPYQGPNLLRYNGTFTGNDGKNDCTQPGCGKRPEAIENHNFVSASTDDRNHSDLPNNLPDPNSQIVSGLTDLGLYKYDISFEGGKYKGTYYRLHGQDLVQKEGIIGGIKSKNDSQLIKGKLIIEHENYGEEPEVAINNGAFISERSWTSILETSPTRQGGRSDRRYSTPGKVHAIYISEDCTEQKIDFRNITYGDGLTGSQLFLFTVENFEDIVFTPSDDVSICKDESFTLNVTNNFPDILDNDSRITYKWLDPDKNEIATTKQHEVTNAQKEQEGTYTLEIKFFGCTLTYEVKVLINAETFTVKTPENLSICESETIELEANEIEDATYTWIGPNGYTANTRQISIPNTTVTMSGDYIVTVSAKNCQGNNVTGTSTTKVTISPSSFIINQSPIAISICETETLTLDVDEVTNANYEWTGPNGYSAKTREISIPNTTTKMSGEYIVNVTATNCKGVEETKTKTATVTINPNSFSINETPLPITVCENQTIELEIDEVENAIYSWIGPNGFTANTRQISIPNATATMAGDYTVTVTAKNCQGTDESKTSTINVSINNDSFSINSSPTPISICENETLTLEINQVPNATYSWIGPNGFTANTRQISIPNTTVDMTGDYTVTVTAKNCQGTDESKSSTTQVTINANSFIINENPNPLNVCEKTLISLEIDEVTDAKYHWIGPNNFEADTRIVEIPNASLEMSGDYTVAVTAINCLGIEETKLSTVVVTVSLETFPVNQAPQPVNVCLDERIELEIDAIPNASYSWEGPNNFTATTREVAIPNASIDMTGNYIITTTITNCLNEEVSQTNRVLVTVTDCSGTPTTTIPSFFTPNQDGINDTWTVDNNLFSFTTINIYNRFGKLIKQLTPENNSWDGTYNGRNMPSNDYWYVINYVDKPQDKGHFSLLRK